MKIISGIYAIYSEYTGKMYIGSSKDIRTRLRNHFNELRKNKHHSSYLQNSFNKYGEKVFETMILEEVQENELLVKEQWYLDILDCANPNLGYNSSPTADRATMSEYGKKKVSESNYRRLANGEDFGKGNRGKKYSEERMAKIYEKQERIAELLRSGIEAPDIIKDLKCDKDTIRQVRRKYNIPMSKKSASNMPYTKEKIEQIAKAIKDGMTNKEVCEKYNTNNSYIAYIKREYNLFELSKKKDLMILELYNKSYRRDEIAKIVGVNPKTVYNVKKRNDLLKIKEELCQV